MSSDCLTFSFMIKVIKNRKVMLCDIITPALLRSSDLGFSVASGKAFRN